MDRGSRRAWPDQTEDAAREHAPEIAPSSASAACAARGIAPAGCALAGGGCAPARSDLSWHGCDLRLLRVKDVVVLTQLGRSSVFEALRRGELRSLTIGRSRRVRPSDLERWIRERIADGG